MAGEVSFQSVLGKSNLPVTNAQQLAYVLIEANPTGAVADVQMPLNFTLVLDHSGSMGGEKLRNLKDAVKLVLQQLQPHDYLSLTIFNGQASVLSASQPVSHVAHLKSIVDEIKDSGGTKISKGMTLGLKEAQKALDPSRVNRMLLLTDGQTWGDEDQCKQLAAQAGSQGIAITALGLGDDWNSDLLDAIANASGGNSDFIDDPDKIQPHFQSTLQSMQATVVKNAQLTLRLVRGITPRKAWRVVPMITELNQKSLSDRDVQIHLGDLEKDQGQALIIELLLPPRAAGNYRIAQAEISYDVPAKGLVGEKVRTDIMMSFTTDATQSKQYDAKVMNLVEKVTAFNLQTRALHDVKENNVAAATQKLRAAATRLLNMGETELAEAAQQEAQRLEQGKGLSSKGTKKLQYKTRKLTEKI